MWSDSLFLFGVVCGVNEVRDVLGECCFPSQQDCAGICNGMHVRDACNICRLPGDYYANSTCTGCDDHVYPFPALKAIQYDCENMTICESPDDAAFGACRKCGKDAVYTAQWYNGDGDLLGVDVIAVRDNLPDVINDTVQVNLVNGSDGVELFLRAKGSSHGQTQLYLTGDAMATLLVTEIAKPDDTGVTNPVSQNGFFEFEVMPGMMNRIVLASWPAQSEQCVEIHINEHSSICRLQADELGEAPKNGKVKICSRCRGKILDACGVLLYADDPRFNLTCLGCDKIPNSGKEYDACHVCGGDGSSCSSSNNIAPAIAIGVLALCCLGSICYWLIPSGCEKKQKEKSRPRSRNGYNRVNQSVSGRNTPRGHGHRRSPRAGWRHNRSNHSGSEH